MFLRSRVDCGPVSRLRNSLFVGAGAGQPGFFGDDDFAQGFVGCFAVRGAKFEVRNIGDPAIVLVMKRGQSSPFALASCSMLTIDSRSRRMTAASTTGVSGITTGLLGRSDAVH